MEKSCWAVGRWAETYLMSESLISPQLDQAYGVGGKGSIVVQALTSISTQLLWGSQWLGEVDLHRIVIVRILGTLARSKASRDVMLKTPDWHNILGKTRPKLS